MSGSSPIPTAALEFHTGIVGKTGSGKSFAAQGEVERLIARHERVCIIDPTDRYWGLRLSQDGKKPSGHEVVIFGGAHADLPLAATHGAALAEIVGTTATPVIIATRLMTVSERTRFFTDFAETLLRKNEGPLHLVIDEAHLFAPQSGAKVGGAAPAMLHAANNLVSLGRGIGLRIILISQRPAKLHKDSLTQVETLVALRLIAPQDRNAIREWVKEWADEATGAEMMQSLPSLPTGTAWVWSPELGVLHKGKFPTVATFDSGKPMAAGKGPALVPIDLAAVRGKLEVVAKEAIENDPARLKKRIAELEREASKAPAPGERDDSLALQASQAHEILTRQLQEAHERMAGMAEESGRVVAENLALREALDSATGALGRIAELAADFGAGAVLLTKLPPVAQNYVAPRINVPEGMVARRAPPPAPPKPAAGNGHAAPKPRADGINGPQRRILDALAWWESVGISGPTRVQVAVVAGYSVGAAAFRNPLSALRSSGLVEYPYDARVSLTDTGRPYANAPAVAPTTAVLHQKVLAILNGPQRRVLQPLLAAYPEQLSREDLAAAAEYEPGGAAFRNPLSALRSLGLVDYPAKGEVRAEPVLFIGGRR